MIQFQYQYPGFKIKSARKIKSWLTMVARGEKKKIGSLVYVFISVVSSVVYVPDIVLLYTL